MALLHLQDIRNVPEYLLPRHSTLKELRAIYGRELNPPAEQDMITRAIALDVYQTLIPPPMPIDPKKEFPVRKGFRELMERCRERDVKVAITSDMPLEIVLEDLRDYGINQEQFYMFRRLNQCPKDFSLIIKECEIKPWELFVIGDCIWKDMEGAARYGARGFQVPKYDFRDDSFDLNSIVF